MLSDEQRTREPEPENAIGRKTRLGSFIRELREMFRILVISLVIVLPIRFFVAQPFIVRGASMQPTYDNGEYLIVDELSYRFSEPHRGDVIIFRYPLDPSQFYIKRIIGLPGEMVIIRGGRVGIQVKGSSETVFLTEPYLPSAMSTVPEKVLSLEDDEFFVLGDNRHNSSDSRQWGVLPEEYVVGKAFIRLWPLSHISLL